MAVVALRKCLIVLMILYALSILVGLLACVPMILHVYPRSECILFSSQGGQDLYYGHYASESLMYKIGVIFPKVKFW